MIDLQWKYNNNRLRYSEVVGGESKPANDDITEESVICNVPEDTFVKRVNVLVEELDSANREDITIKVGNIDLTVEAGKSIATTDLNITSNERIPVTVVCADAKGVNRIMVMVEYIAFDRVNIKQIKPIEVEA